MMFPETPLYKRIKRHVIGRTRRYFVVSPPGFETLCLKELASLAFSVEDASVVSGGVEFSGYLHDCYVANLNLRSANRILLRIHEFKATNFRQLTKKIAAIPWELYLYPHQQPVVHAAMKHCRLYHTDAVAEHILTSITKRLKETAVFREAEDDASIDQRIFVRGKNDQFIMSIDSSGEILYKRGIKKHTGKAPIRETIAAAALLSAGYRGTQPVLDPLCGTGTFSLEAALMAKKIPAGWFREFAFMGWPSFQRKRWEYIKRQAAKSFVSRRRPLIFASDQNPSACRRLEKCIQQFDLSDTVKVFNKNFFDVEPNRMVDQPGLVAINPPYGRRMGSRQKSEQLFVAVCDRLKRAYNGWKLVLIIPSRQLVNKVPFQLDVLPFTHGGLKLALMVGVIT